MLIYLITNKINNKKYVGLTTRTLEDRIKEHEYEARYIRKKYIHKAINKYGIENFNFEVLEYVDEDTIYDKEIYYIAKIGTLKPKGYNLTRGGEGMTGYKHTEDTKRKIAKSSKSKIKEWQADKEYWRQRNTNLSNKLKGKKFSKEHKAKLSIIAKERVGDKNPFYGKIHSDETKQKIGNANKGNISTRRVGIIAYTDTVEIGFNSYMEAFEYLLENSYTTNKNRTSVSSGIKQVIETGKIRYGFKWRYQK